MNKLGGHFVQYIDFGNSAVVAPQKIYPVEKKLMQLPKQAVQCSLQNIVPEGGAGWSNVNTGAIDSCFNADKYECTFHGMEDKYLISLNNFGNDVANMLIEKKLASLATASKSNEIIEGKENLQLSEFSNIWNRLLYMIHISISLTGSDGTTQAIPCDVERVDINLLSGQALRVKVSSVESVSQFYVQLPTTATICESMVNTYMADKDPKVCFTSLYLISSISI